MTHFFSQSAFKTFFLNSPLAISIYDLDNGEILDVNLEWCNIMKLSKEEVIGKSLGLVMEEERTIVKGELGELLENKSLKNYDTAIRLKDGTQKFVNIFSELIIDDGRRISISLIKDITERKEQELLLKEKSEEIEAQNEEYRQINEELYKAKEKIEKSEELFRKAFLTNPESITINRLDTGEYTSVNYGFTKMLEYTEDEAVGHTSMELHVWLSQEERNHFVTLLRENGLVDNLEAKFQTKSGKIIDCLVSSVIIELDNSPHIISITRDFTYRKKIENDILIAKNQIEESAKEFKLLAEAMPQIVWITRADGWNIYFNQQWVDYTGLSLEESYGHSWNIPFHPDDKQGAWNAWQNAVNNNSEYTIECQLRRKDGIYRWWLIRGVPILENGKIIKWFGTCTDIHDIKQTAFELIKAKEKAEESDKLKTAFLQNLSHEIRTPLNAICGFTSMLNKKDLSDEKKQNFISIIQKNSDQLLSIVSDILTISSLETKQEKLTIEKININDILVFLLSSFKQQASKQNISIYSRKPLSDTEAQVYADKTKLTQVISNLLTNALKFTYQGSVEFGYQLSDSTIEFFVKDTGIGIAPELQESIFERFRQAETSMARNYGGTGLGLSISKGFVELMGGNIWVESRPGLGSTFYFTLPYYPVISDTAEKSVKKTDSPLILIAEDEEFNYLYLEENISDLGLKIIHATNGKEAIDICRNNLDVQLVLMDIKMPVTDGYTAAKLIKEIRPELPIIAQTAYALDHEIKKFDGVFSDYLVKPIRESVLKEKISKYFPHIFK